MPKLRHGDDRHVVHEVRDDAVRVPRDDRLQSAARQLAREPEDLAAVVARLEVVRIRSLAAPAACVRREHDDVRAALAQRARLARDGRRERLVASPSTCAASVCRKPVSVIVPMMPTRTPAASTIADGATFGQRTGLPVAASTMFAARNGKRARAAAAFNAPCMSPGASPPCVQRAATAATGPRGSTEP